MAVKGKFKILGEVEVQEAYAVIDSIQISKGGDGFAHVSLYARPPERTMVDSVAVVDGQDVARKEESVNRGPVMEHFTVSGIQFDVPQSPMQTAYEFLASYDRTAAMLAA